MSWNKMRVIIRYSYMIGVDVGFDRIWEGAR
jgi:hypothetical protein